MQKNYGWIPDKPDARDMRAMTPRATLPTWVDLRTSMPGVYDQGSLGSCTANAVLGQVHYRAIKQKQDTSNLSRLFTYYVTRTIQNTVNYDSGASLRDSIKSLNLYGTCRESSWPYTISQFTVKPKAECYSYAAGKKVRQYARVDQTETAMKAQIAAGNPISFGCSIYSSFEGNTARKTGMVPMPKVFEEQYLGGHAMLIVGYKDSIGCWIVRNSWGTQWGDKGYIYMPYKYLTDPQMASDFWIVTEIPKAMSVGYHKELRKASAPKKAVSKKAPAEKKKLTQKKAKGK